MITRVSVVGISIITASLVILLSAFNGIEKMIERLYSDFDSPIIIEAAQTKTFFEQQLDFKQLKKVEGVSNISRVARETVVLKHEDNWANAHLVGVDTSFLKISKMSQHMVDGFPVLSEGNQSVGIIGASLLDQLGGYIHQSFGHESIIVYGPKRNMKMSIRKNPFNTQVIPIVGRMNFNKDVNSEILLVPFETSQAVLGYDSNELSALFIGISSSSDKYHVKKQIQEVLGKQFEVKTNDEKNKLIFQTSKTERLIVIVILVFVFILASFNLVASITMLFVEKKEDLHILKSMGANSNDIFKIFFFEGLLISAKGILFGLIIGYAICFIQLQLSILTMPNSFGEAFPIGLKITDTFLILFLVSILSVLASYFPVKMLLKRNEIK